MSALDDRLKEKAEIPAAALQKRADSDAAASQTRAASQPDKSQSSRAENPRLSELLRGPFDIKSFSLTGLFIFALFTVIYITRAVLLPIVFAILLSYLLAPLVRTLARTLRLPTLFGAAAVIASLLALAGFLITRLTTPASNWMEAAPYSFHRLEEKLLPLRKPMQKVSEASAEIEKITKPDAALSVSQPGKPSPQQQPQQVQVEVKTTKITDEIFHQTPDILAGSLTMLILLYFLLAYDEIFLAKLVKVMPRLEDKKRALTIAREIETCVSKYLFTVACINTALGTAVGTAMYFLKMPNPALWGVMAATLNFVPYLGATVGIVSMTLAAVVSFDHLGHAFACPGAYLALAIIEGNFITPMVLGRSFTLNPIVILIALMFWGWMWGIMGAILAVPILVTFKIFCDHIEPLAPVSEMLST